MSQEESPMLSPDEAFSVLGNETRIQILQVLGEADGPLLFSELFDRVEYDNPGNFSYHLDTLGGHFVRKTDEGYELRQAAKRIVKAVLSGAVTEAPVLEPSTPDRWPCPYCGAHAEIGYDHERLWTACPECVGTYGEAIAPGTLIGPAGHGYIGHARLPPAGIKGRTTREVTEAAAAWGHLDFLALASGICPRCAAPVEHAVAVCEDHEPATTDTLCGRCHCRHAVQLHARCTNCIHEEVTPFALGRLIATNEFLAHLAASGINPVAPTPGSGFYAALLDYDEEVISTDPFEARFTMTIDDTALTLTVDDDLRVVDATASRAPRQG